MILMNILIKDMELDLILVLFFSIPNLYWGKNVVIFGVDMSSSVDTDNKNKDTLNLDKGSTQDLDDTTLRTEAENFVNF